jgi:hypothetical protein
MKKKDKQKRRDFLNARYGQSPDMVNLALGYWNISSRMIVPSQDCAQNMKRKI